MTELSSHNSLFLPVVVGNRSCSCGDVCEEADAKHCSHTRSWNMAVNNHENHLKIVGCRDNR